MTDEMRAREKAICEVANVNDIGEVSDGFSVDGYLLTAEAIRKWNALG